MNSLKNTFSLGALAVAAAICIPADSANAQLTIVRNSTGGTAPGNTAGGGDLDTIFNAACDWWEVALVTTPAHTLTLNYNWGPKSGSVLASHSLVSQGGTPNRETEGNITFDNDGSTVWFVDPTPCDNSEFTTFTNNTGNYGGGAMTDDVAWTGPTGDAVGRYDLMRTALHEVGHALGLSSANVAFQAERVDGDIDVTAPRPYAGSALPLQATSAHLTTCNFLMGGGCASTGQRRFPSEADLLANAQISQWPGINPITACPNPGGSPLTTTFASNNGGSGIQGVYFSLEAMAGTGGVTITEFDLNCTAPAGSSVGINVYVQPNDGSCGYEVDGLWYLRSAATGTAAGQDNPTSFVLSTPIELGEGCCLGVGIEATGAVNWGHRYTNGASNPEIYDNGQLRMTAGRASGAFGSGTVFEPRVANTNIYYSLGGACSDVAVATPYGSGCLNTWTSFYEFFDAATMDLEGLEVYGDPVFFGQNVNTRPATINPVGSLGTAQPLTALGDDDSVDTVNYGGTLGLHVASNCWVAYGPNNSTFYVPSVQTMLDNPSEGYYAWTDLEPNAANSGLVYYEEAGQRWQVTYDGVYLWGTTDPVTVQFRGNATTGRFAIAFGAGVNASTGRWAVGHSGAGISTDPGPRDLSQATLFGFLMANADQDGLELAPVAAPVLGAPFELQTTNIPAGPTFHFGLIGLNQIAVPLQFAFPSAQVGCFLNVSTDLVLGPDFPAGNSLTWQGFDLTNILTPAAIGADVHFQAATLDLTLLSPTTRTSNGVRATLGLY